MAAMTILDGYFTDAGDWIAKAPDWTDAREMPRDRVYRVMESGDPEVLLCRWGKHAGEGHECWVSAIDPYVELRPRWFRDLVRPPTVRERYVAYDLTVIEPGDVLTSG